MAVNLSPIGGVAGQFFTNNGTPLAGGKIFTYAAGTTTPQATYTTASGGVAHTNPIILDSAGRVPSGEIWLTDGLAYKFIIKDSNDVLIGTYDNVSGINSNFVNFTNRQEIQTATAGQTVFNLTTMQYQPGTNSLSVFVDGVNQYGPGASYAYLETDSDTVTFTTGLHVGAEVKFTSSQLNSSAGGDAFNVSYTPPFTGSVTTNVGDKLAQTVSVKDFGAVGDGVTDDTAAIQAALNYVSSSKNALFFPRGLYLFTQLIFPSRGEVFGESIADFGFPGDTNYATTLMQKQGVNNDAIIFDTTVSGSFERIQPLYLHDFALTKQSGWTDTVGNGISFRKQGDRSLDATHALLGGNTIIARVLVRGFPENGIYQRRGARPAYFQEVYTLFNKKSGYRTDGLNGNYGLWINGFASDGNIEGAISISGSPSNQTISITNVYHEPRTDNPYGNTSGFSYAGPRAIQIQNFGSNCIVQIQNVFVNSNGTEAADAAIYVDCTTSANIPNLYFNAVNLVKTGTSSGNAYVLKDVLNTIDVPYTVNSGVYTQNKQAFSLVGSNNFIVAGETGVADTVSTVTNGFQAIGNLPGFGWKSTGAAADQKRWFMRMSTTGQIILAAATDAGAVSNAFLISRSGGTPTLFQIPINFQVDGTAVTLSNIPTYANNAAAVAAGLGVGRIYKTATGELRIVV